MHKRQGSNLIEIEIKKELKKADADLTEDLKLTAELGIRQFPLT